MNEWDYKEIEKEAVEIALKENLIEDNDHAKQEFLHEFSYAYKKLNVYWAKCTYEQKLKVLNSAARFVA